MTKRQGGPSAFPGQGDGSDDVVTLVGNVLKGVGYALQESGRLVTAVCRGEETGQPGTPDAIANSSFSAVGTLVRAAEDYTVQRAVVAESDDDAPAHTATIDWGDSSPRTVGEAVRGKHGRVAVIGSHAYASAGDYTITTLISRGDAAVGRATSVAIVGGARARFAARAFRRLLGRPIDAEHEAALAGAGRHSREAIVRAILVSREYRSARVARLYAGILGRPPHEEELARSIEMVESGDTTPLRAALLGSSECFERSARGQVAALAGIFYGEAFGRSALPAERAELARKLADAAARHEVALALLGAAEARVHAVREAALTYARRPAHDRDIAAAASVPGAHPGAYVFEDEIILSTFDLQSEIFAGDPGTLSPGAVADFAVQFLVPLEQDLVDGFVNQIQKQFRDQFKIEPDVRSSQLSGQTLVAAWVTQSADPDRQAWINRTAGDASIAAGAVAGFFASLAFLNTSAQNGFATAPKRYQSATGAPDIHGDVELTGIAVSIDADSNTIVTDISGVKTVKLILGVTGDFGVGFTNHLRDTLAGITTDTDCAGTPFQRIQVDSSASTEVDKGDEAIAGLAAVFQALLFPSGAAPTIGSFFGPQASAPVGGAGAGFIANLPHTQLVPPSMATAPFGKIAFNYSDFKVEPTGVIALTNPNNTATRAPSVKILGPSFIAVFKFGGPLHPLQQTYSVQPCDLLGDANGVLPVQWQALEPSTVVVSPNAPTTQVRFSATLAVGASTTRRLHVRVGPDHEGNTAEQTLQVTIKEFERVVVPPPRRPLQRIEE